MTEAAMQAPAAPEQSADYYPNVHITTLGRSAVRVCREAAAGRLSGGEYGRAIDRAMKNSRIRLAKLDARQSDQFDTICADSLPSDLLDVKAAEAGQASWQDWLGTDADDEQLMQYVRWHAGMIEEQQEDPAILETVATQRELYKQNVSRGLKEGWLHEAAAGAVRRVDNVDVFIGDVFGTALDESVAYCKRTYRPESREKKEVVIGCATAITEPGVYTSTRERAEQVAQHEFNHAVLGGFGIRWLNEAATEHIAQVLQYGDLHALLPGDRRETGAGRPIYAGERRLLDALLTRGAYDIPVELVTLAYSEEPPAVQTAHQAFIDAVNRSWNHMTPSGTDAYYLFNQYAQSMESRLTRFNPSRRAAQVQAMHNVYRDLEHQPNIVFGGDSSKRRILTHPV